MQTVARTLFFATLATLTFGLVGPLPVSPAAGPTSPARPPQVVYLGHDLPDECLLRSAPPSLPPTRSPRSCSIR